MCFLDLIDPLAPGVSYNDSERDFCSKRSATQREERGGHLSGGFLSETRELFALALVTSRSRKIEQPPDEVVAECAASLGVRPTCATGWVNWFGQFSMMRLVPTWAAVRIMSDGTRTTTKLDDVPQKA